MKFNDPLIHVNDHDAERSAFKLGQLEFYRLARQYPHSGQIAVERVLWRESLKKLDTEHEHKLLNTHINLAKNKSSLAIWHDVGNYLLLVEYENTSPCCAHVIVMSKDPKTTPKLLKMFRKNLVKMEPENDEIFFTFWMWSGSHSRSRDTLLSVPSFDSLRSNYRQDAFDAIEEMASLDRPDEFGKIILWHGPPGNGKTYLIRALAHKWATEKNASIEVVTDPEALFRNPNYLQSVLTSDYDENGPDKLRLLVLEDCGQLFSVEGRQRDGFNRLLNTTDGLLGQGQRVIYLLTANEEIEHIDKAVLRAGRCLQQQQILPLTRTEASRWLKEHDIEPPKNLKSNTSLADLYEMRHNYKTQREQSNKTSKIGF